MVGALYLGLDDLVAVVRKDTKCSDFYIHGFQRLSGEMRRFATVTAMSSCVAQAALGCMIEDDRSGRTLGQLEAIVADELRWLTETMDGFCLSQLVCVVAAEGCSASELRTEVVFNAHVSAAFLDRRVFRPARELPWLLVTGQGVEAELDALAAMEAVPSDPAAAKIQGLMKVGYNRAALVEAVELLRDIRWSSATVEQGHRSASIIAQLHMTMGSDMLMQRSYFHMMKPLVTA